jgi:hypothetical protein
MAAAAIVAVVPVFFGKTVLKEYWWCLSITRLIVIDTINRYGKAIDKGAEEEGHE